MDTLGSFGAADSALSSSTEDIGYTYGAACLRSYNPTPLLHVDTTVDCRHSKRKQVSESGSRTKISVRDPLLQAYLFKKLRDQQCESLIGFFADTDDHYVAERHIARGSRGEVAIPRRDIVQMSQSLGCRSILLVHNHPSGCLEPSQSDVDSTLALISDFSVLRIRLIDHLIVAGTRIFSICQNVIL